MKGGTPMLILPHTLARMIGAFAPTFLKRVFEHVKLPTIGAILAPGKANRHVRAARDGEER
jgi:hypothetical protein